MSSIIDRRLNPRDKNVKNRQKFIQRTKDQIRDAVKDSINGGNIADITNGKLRVKIKGVSEPTFGIDRKTGNKKFVMPGNDKYVVGDTEEKPEDQQSGGGASGGRGRSQDEVEFILSSEEYLDFIFDDLELPDLVKKQIKDVTKVKPVRNGYTNTGSPNQLDVVRSLRNSLGRRIGLKRPKQEEIDQVQQLLNQAREDGDQQKIHEYQLLLDELLRKQKVIPWLDPFDVRYRNYTMQPQPVTKAVMFCVMDVSASMGQREKDLAKRFFFLLHMFLNRKYEKVDIIFIRHHEEASEVDEQEFFYSKESGGTVVSSALELTNSIIDQRYNPSDWNIYVAQASDGDNFSEDNEDVNLQMSKLLPKVQYFAYVEIKTYLNTRNSDLWEMYDELLGSFANLEMRQVRVVADIWKVFRELFSKEGVS